MRKPSSELLTGNNQFEGYVVDLIGEIARILGFNYTFRIVPDGRYGSMNRATHEWDGMIGELLEQVPYVYVCKLVIIAGKDDEKFDYERIRAPNTNFFAESRFSGC